MTPLATIDALLDIQNEKNKQLTECFESAERAWAQLEDLRLQNESLQSLVDYLKSKGSKHERERN